MPQFLIIVGFCSMVWAGSVTLLYIMACRELDVLKRKEQESAERAKHYSDYADQQRTELTQLRQENARLGTNLWLCREYAKKQRALRYLDEVNR